MTTDPAVIYMDVCCLNRPFDRQTQGRIRIETEAVIIIVDRCTGSDWVLVGSDAIAIEISRIPDAARQRDVTALAAAATKHVTVDQSVEERAGDLVALGFKPLGALHIACAESANASVMLTTDDRLERRAARVRRRLRVRVANPARWLVGG